MDQDSKGIGQKSSFPDSKVNKQVRRPGSFKLFTRERLLHHRFPFLAGEDTPQTPGALSHKQTNKQSTKS